MCVCREACLSKWAGEVCVGGGQRLRSGGARAAHDVASLVVRRSLAEGVFGTRSRGDKRGGEKVGSTNERLEK